MPRHPLRQDAVSVGGGEMMGFLMLPPTYPQPFLDTDTGPHGGIIQDVKRESFSVGGVVYDKYVVIDRWGEYWDRWAEKRLALLNAYLSMPMFIFRCKDDLIKVTEVVKWLEEQENRRIEIVQPPIVDVPRIIH